MGQTTAIFIVTFLAAGLMMSGFLYYLTRVQKKIDAEANGGAVLHERTERPVRRESPMAYTVASPAPVAPVAEPMPITEQPAKLTQREVWDKLNNAIHLLLVGETFSGKSTTAEAVLWGRAKRGDQIVIIDPHASPDDWRGMPAVGAGRDYPAIERVMLALLDEMTSRFEERKTQSGYNPQTLTIFVDEWPGIQTACQKVASRFLVEIAQEGRKVNMRLVVLTQSNRVESLGIAGKGDVRENLTLLSLGSKALEVCPAAATTFARPAAMNTNGTFLPANTGFIPEFAKATMPDYVCLWQPEAIKVGTSDDEIPEGFTPDLYRRLKSGESLLEPIETGSQSGGMAHSTGEPVAPRTGSQSGDLSASYQAKPVVRTDEKPDQINVPDDELSILIRAAHAAGMSRNKMTQLLIIPGGRADQLKRIKQALGETE